MYKKKGEFTLVCRLLNLLKGQVPKISAIKVQKCFG